MSDFKAISGFNGKYLVSSTGYVQSLMGKSPRILKFRFDQSGYRRVRLYGRDYSIHRLVAMTFLPTWNEFLEVNHIDGDRLNNNVDNLEMCTHLENMRHAFRVGLVKNTVRGETHHLSKLSLDEVKEIKQLLVLGISPTVIAMGYPTIKRNNITEIAAGRSWRHV